MKIAENNKFFAWLVSAFPNWNVGQATAAIWAQELPDVAAEIAIEAVRRLQANDPKPFPPGVFEIVGALKGRVDPYSEAMLAFAEFWNNAGNSRSVKALPKAFEAFMVATGGAGYGQAITDDRTWYEKRFCEIYEALGEKEVFSGPLLPDGRPRLSAGSKAIPTPAEVDALNAKSEAALLAAYPSGKIPADEVKEARALVAAQMKIDQHGAGVTRIDEIMKGVMKE